MSWVSLATALLKLSNAIMSYLHDNKMIKAGEDKVYREALDESIKLNKKMADARNTVIDSSLSDDPNNRRVG